MKKKNATKTEKSSGKLRSSPLLIPLDFEQAVDALLKVKPKKKRSGDQST